MYLNQQKMIEDAMHNSGEVHSPQNFMPEPSILAAAILAIGSPDFFVRVLEMLANACHSRSGGAMIFHRAKAPQRLIHWVNLKTRSVPEDAYLNGPYVLDPHYALFLDGCTTGCYWLQDIAPDNFSESEYFQAFYSRIGIRDSMDVLWRVDNDSALSFFIERGHDQGLFEQADIKTIQSLMPIVDALCRRHQEQSVWTAQDSGRDLTHLKLESALANFGKSLLSKRERQVLVLTLRGYSAIMAGEKLFTSEGTIKIHRKNIHRKLDIGSQAELFALFVRCIPYADPSNDVDPLSVYESRPQSEKVEHASLLLPSSGLATISKENL